MKVRIISVIGENHRYNEDFAVAEYQGGKLKVALGDWANNLVGGPYKDLSIRKDKYNGGFIGATIAKNVIKNSEDSGHRLLQTINDRLSRKYQELISKGHSELEDYGRNRALAFTGYIAHLIITPEQAIVTAIGDVRVAADGKHIAGKTKKVDIVHALARKAYIRETGDSEGGFNFLRPLILRQFDFQNMPGHPLSYPAIDGTETLPREAVELLTLPTPRHILVWTDGYLPPDEFTLEGLEKKLAYAYHDDPFRFERYPAVGFLKDDRTALEITDLGNWNALTVEDVTKVFRKV